MFSFFRKLLNRYRNRIRVRLSGGFRESFTVSIEIPGRDEYWTGGMWGIDHLTGETVVILRREETASWFGPQGPPDLTQEDRRRLHEILLGEFAKYKIMYWEDIPKYPSVDSLPPFDLRNQRH